MNFLKTYFITFEDYRMFVLKNINIKLTFVQSIISPIDMTFQMREKIKPVFQKLKNASLISRN